MGEEGRRETGDKRMVKPVQYIVEGGRKKREKGEGGRREQGDTRRGMQTYMFMSVNSKQT